MLILLYHRVTELPIDPQLLCVTPQHFGEHLEILRKYFNPFSLRRLVEGLRTGRLPARATVITFDDGYFDNLGDAKPILGRYDVPATVFIATGYLGGTREFWWDELERLLLHGRKLPDVLRLNIDGRGAHWELGQAAEPMEEWLEQNRHWNVLNLKDVGSRQHLYASLCRLLRPLTHQARESALDALRTWAGEEAAGRASHRALLPEEVVQLAEGSRIEVGAHTVTHPVLSALSVEAQREEVSQSKARLQEILNEEVTSFSYPFGTQTDYSPATVDVVKEAGFTCACSNFAGITGPGTSPFELPRVLIRDWDGDTLTRHLHEAFDA